MCDAYLFWGWGGGGGGGGVTHAQMKLSIGYTVQFAGFRFELMQ